MHCTAFICSRYQERLSSFNMDAIALKQIQTFTDQLNATWSIYALAHTTRDDVSTAYEAFKTYRNYVNSIGHECEKALDKDVVSPEKHTPPLKQGTTLDSEDAPSLTLDHMPKELLRLVLFHLLLQGHVSLLTRLKYVRAFLTWSPRIYNALQIDAFWKDVCAHVFHVDVEHAPGKKPKQGWLFAFLHLLVKTFSIKKYLEQNQRAWNSCNSLQQKQLSGFNVDPWEGSMPVGEPLHKSKHATLLFPNETMDTLTPQQSFMLDDSKHFGFPRRSLVLLRSTPLLLLQASFASRHSKRGSVARSVLHQLLRVFNNDQCVMLSQQTSAFLLSWFTALTHTQRGSFDVGSAKEVSTLIKSLYTSLNRSERRDPGILMTLAQTISLFVPTTHPHKWKQVYTMCKHPNDVVSPSVPLPPCRVEVKYIHYPSDFFMCT